MNNSSRRRFLQYAGYAALSCAMHAAPGKNGLARAAGRRRSKPNIFFIFIDDLGWRDLSCYGSSFYRSPNIDKLASQGMRFTDAYAACPVCSPTRASVLSGMYPASVNLTDFIPGHWRPWAKMVVPKFNLRLPADVTTIPEVLKPAGYVSGGFGKWHLGGGRASPERDHGFDVYEHNAPNDDDKRAAGLTRKALDFVDKHKDRPFFVYLSHHTVHIPIQAKRKTIERYRKRLRPGQKFPQQDNPAYAAMVEAMDATVGTVMARLEELDLADETVVILASDNGGLHKTFTGRGDYVTSNAPLRDEKGSLYEGGIRVPLIVRWPGVVKAGTECNVPVSSIDFLPTFAGIAGTKSPEVDGESLLKLLTGKGKPERKALYWHYPHYHHTAPCGAVRAGDFKLIEFFEDGDIELYNLAEDLGERHNLAKKMADKAEDLRRMLAAWRKSVGAQMPTANKDYAPEKAHLWRRRKRRK